MKKYVGILAVTLFALSSFSAQANPPGSSFANPIEEGGCGASYFEDVQGGYAFVDFSVPQLADGESIEVQGVGIRTGSYSLTFTCSNGTISNGGLTGDWWPD